MPHFVDRDPMLALLAIAKELASACREATKQLERLIESLEPAEPETSDEPLPF